MTKRRQDCFRITSCAQMVQEAMEHDYVYVDVEIARDYMLDHMFDSTEAKMITFSTTVIQGVLMVRYADPTDPGLPF